MRLSLAVLVLAAIAVGAYYYFNSGTDHVDHTEVQGFSAVVVKGSGTLNLSYSDTESVKVRGITKDRVTIQNLNGVLVITPKGDASDAFYIVSIKQLNAITAEGSVRVISNDRFDIGDLTIIGRDQAHLYLAVKGNFVNARVENTANVLLSGLITEQHVVVQDQGKYESAGLVCRKATISVVNHGEAWINVTEQLNASVFDHGILHYGGDPGKVTKTLKDSGVLDRLE